MQHNGDGSLKIYNIHIVILPVVLYGCGTLSVTFREEHRLRVLEKRMLRRMFGPKRQEVCALRSFVICTAYRILQG